MADQSAESGAKSGKQRKPRPNTVLTADLVGSCLVDHYHHFMTAAQVCAKHDISTGTWSEINKVHGPAFVEQFGKLERPKVDAIDMSSWYAARGAADGAGGGITNGVSNLKIQADAQDDVEDYTEDVPLTPIRSKPAGRPAGKPVGKPAAQPAAQPAGRPVGKQMNAPAGRPVAGRK